MWGLGGLREAPPDSVHLHLQLSPQPASAACSKSWRTWSSPDGKLMSSSRAAEPVLPLGAWGHSEQDVLPQRGLSPTPASRSWYLRQGFTSLSTLCQCPTHPGSPCFAKGPRSLSSGEAGLGSGVCSRHRAPSLILKEGTVLGHVEGKGLQGKLPRVPQVQPPSSNGLWERLAQPCVDTQAPVITFSLASGPVPRRAIHLVTGARQ